MHDFELRNNPTNILIEYRVDYPDADSSGPEQPEFIDTIHRLLDEAGIEYDHRSNGVSQGDGLSKSRWVVQEIGNTDTGASLTFSAASREAFEARSRMVVESQGLPFGLEGLQVEVYGLAALDADTAEPPYRQMPHDPS